MEPMARRILAIYDELDRDRLDLHTFFELVGGNEPAQRQTVLDTITQLAGQGRLQSAGGDFYQRTEDGRLAICGPRVLTLYSRPQCHLCDEAKAALLPLIQEFGAALREVNIDDDPVLRQRYNDDVPVIFLGPLQIAKHRVDPAQLRSLLTASQA